MARAATTERLMTRTVSDPGFLLLPEVVQHLWYRLLSYALGAQEKGRIRFPGFSGSVSHSVSKLVPMAETEIETGLEILETLGWVERDEETHSLWMPGARAGAARSDAARANGTRGGAPRKGESKEAYRARKEEERRRQGTLLMGIPGGATETQGTQEEPNDESSCATTTTTSLREVSGGSTAREETAAAALARELAKEAGLPEHRKLDPEPVAAWLAAGVSPAMIRSVVGTVASRRSYDPVKVMTWRFFNGGIEEARGLASTAKPASEGCRAEVGVLDEDGATAGLNANGQMWVKGWKQLVLSGHPTGAKEATMKAAHPEAWALVQSLKKRPEYQNPEKFRSDQPTGEKMFTRA